MDAQDIESHVHLGAWTNWSRGPVMGRTLTLTRSQGNLLIAFTASFVAFVATRFWRIVAIVCHRCYSNPKARTTLHHQRQLTLRNSSSPEAALFSFLGLAYAWRRSVGLWRLLGLVKLAVLSVLITVAFILAGGFSSTIASAVGNTVLLTSSHCGFPFVPQEASEVGAYLSYTANMVNTAANYAQQCYSTGRSSGILDCDRFVQDHISWDVDIAAPCPFPPDMCRSQGNNLRLDTGPMDVNTVLGLNEATGKRTTLRRVLHCAPLVTEGFASKSTASQSNTTLVKYFYGSRPNSGDGYNYTYQVRDIASQYQYLDEGGGQFLQTNFLVEIMASQTLYGATNAELSHFIPIPSLERTDADVALVFLSGNGIVFHQPIHDEWYRATTEAGTILVSDAAGSAPYYIPDEAAIPLGCVEQYQYCNLVARDHASSGQQNQEQSCGPLASFQDAAIGAAPLFNSSVEQITSSDPNNLRFDNSDLMWLLWLNSVLAQGLGISNLIQFLGAKSLASQASLYGGIQYSTTTNDGSENAGPAWQSDVTRWFATILSNLQGAFISTVIGPTDGTMTKYWEPAEGKAEERFCNIQKIRSTKHTSFSIFGLGFAYALGGVILLVSVAVEPALRFCSHRWGYREYEEVEWVTNNYYQLHRLAHEEPEDTNEKEGIWRACRDTIPITERNELVGTLDVRDRSRPRIARAHSEEKQGNAEIWQGYTEGGEWLDGGDVGNDVGRKGRRSDVHTNLVNGDTSSDGWAPALSEPDQEMNGETATAIATGTAAPVSPVSPVSVSDRS